MSRKSRQFVPCLNETVLDKKLLLNGDVDFIGPPDSAQISTPMDPGLVGWDSRDTGPSLTTTIGDFATSVVNTGVTVTLDAFSDGWYTLLGGTSTPVDNPGP